MGHVGCHKLVSSIRRKVIVVLEWEAAIWVHFVVFGTLSCRGNAMSMSF
jgi:hypothetical protein